MTTGDSASTLARTFANYSPDWWTPAPWWGWAERTLGGELWDPCPATWRPEDPSGLETTWRPRVYCNHPGDRRGSAQRWWRKAQHEQQRQDGTMALVWCAFNVEQLRHLRPSPFHLPGYLVLPRERIGFIWGGPDKLADDGRVVRPHGAVARSPGNWTVFWTTEKPATPPSESVVVRTC